MKTNVYKAQAEGKGYITTPTVHPQYLQCINDYIKFVSFFMQFFTG